VNARRRVLVVGSIALDSIETPYGVRAAALGGSAVYASYAASFFAPVLAVGVVGKDFPVEHLLMLKSRGIDTGGIEVRDGATFRWEGRYRGDMSSAETLSTQLNVFGAFRPQLAADYRTAEYVFLANIDPELQLSVLAQLQDPRIVVCDTMNFWIDSKREMVAKAFAQSKIAMVNDAEAKQISGEASLRRAALSILGMGPEYAVIKKGEHGGLLVGRDFMYMMPAYPLDTAVDPTGAGDSFAGAMLGYLAACRETSPKQTKRAALRGSAVASFAVEGFSLERLQEISSEDIEARVRELVEFTRVETCQD
jgi:sugar/nucleoside kinase (ribokinase family)